MSKKIDLTKPLSDADREYLDSRGRHDLIEQADRLQADSGNEPEPINDGNTGDVDPFKADDGNDGLSGASPDETPLNRVGQAAATEPTVQAGDGEKADGGGEYGEMTNDDLREELESRGLSKSGSKAEMISRLEADDAEDDSEE